MSVVMTLVWKGVTPDQYELLRKMVNWESDAPTSVLRHPGPLEPEIIDYAIPWEGDLPGGLLDHVVSFDGDEMFVTDVWESSEHCERFLKNRMTPVATLLGIKGEPQVEIRPARAWFTPGHRQARAA